MKYLYKKKYRFYTFSNKIKLCITQLQAKLGRLKV